MTLLKACNLHKSYLGKRIVNNLSFAVRQGEVVGLLGPNGAGKTTAFHMTIGLVRPKKGRIFFLQRDVTSFPIHRRATMGMGYLPQEPSVFRRLTVAQNIMCILETLPIGHKERKRRLTELLDELNLSPLADEKAVTLSGGERRRLEVTRALVTNPSLLLLDEPFANIDPITVGDVKHMVRHLRDKGISVLITDHNAREVSSVTDRNYLIREGQVTLEGTSEELIGNKDAQATYFGDNFRL
ncbi:MAG: LPS export ABC transporter ATP-binding protein [Simkaniaceae bacterium]|nr:LPS export ABC transporter ATP-binding protein [Simkaniaceae bacterium]